MESTVVICNFDHVKMIKTLEFPININNFAKYNVIINNEGKTEWHLEPLSISSLNTLGPNQFDRLLL